MKSIILIQAILIIILVSYIVYPKTLKLEADVNSVVVTDGWTTFIFDPPISSEGDSLKIMRFSGKGDAVNLKIYTRF